MGATTLSRLPNLQFRPTITQVHPSTLSYHDGGPTEASFARSLSVK